ncbi:HD domain-containing protein [Pokkaliibacter sp. MBI-7]|uniref:HD domain-containing protein n=1 Tax=Pokkaliibacter sp. MBI-7 TaxID=3040600 RepID=UPI002449E21E|nr:HD domain-containing protein [Pokkaliibacter sp. MBI-7]MDH2433579.1 HD domain-containing protein [Pokkaliibacter sp. MBI-7]
MMNDRELFLPLLRQVMVEDAAHDLAHIERVVANARRLASTEGAELAIVLPAAWLHDCVNVAKDSPLRSQGSRLSADQAVVLLEQIDYPARWLEAIHHAICAHSFSAAITPRTLEAAVVQDADRLDALGAIGIARTFIVGGQLQRTLYSLDDPFCTEREPDDLYFGLDHFYTKLLRLEQSFITAAGRAEAAERTQFMWCYLSQLQQEIV